MKTVNKSASVATAYSQPLPEPITFSYTYEELKKGDPVPEAEKPTDMEELITNYVNAKRNSNARAKAQTAALEAAGIEAPANDDPKVLTRSFFKNLVLSNTAEAEGRQFAEMILKEKYDSSIEWPKGK